MGATGVLLIRILLLAAVKSSTSLKKKFGLPPVNRNPHPNKAAVLEQCERLLAVVSRGGSSDDWYERASQRQKDRYYPNERSDYNNDGYYAEDAEDDYYGDPPTARRQRSDGFLSSVPLSLLRGDRKTGMLLLGSGLAITFLGISLFFNRTLLRFGNLLFIAGVPMTLGPSRTFGYFVKPEKFRATACLGLGIFLVFMGSPLFGIILEFFGLLNLFGNMFPMVWMFAKNIPILGPILKTTSGEVYRKQKQQEKYEPIYEEEGNYDGNDDYYGQQRDGQYYAYEGSGGHDGWDDRNSDSRYY